MPRRKRCQRPVCEPSPRPEFSSRVKRDRVRAARLTARFETYILDGARVSGGQYIVGEDGFSKNVKHLYPELPWEKMK